MLVNDPLMRKQVGDARVRLCSVLAARYTVYNTVTGMCDPFEQLQFELTYIALCVLCCACATLLRMLGW